MTVYILLNQQTIQPNLLPKRFGSLKTMSQLFLRCFWDTKVIINIPMKDWDVNIGNLTKQMIDSGPIRVSSQLYTLSLN